MGLNEKQVDKFIYNTPERESAVRYSGESVGLGGALFRPHFEVPKAHSILLNIILYPLTALSLLGLKYD